MGQKIDQHLRNFGYRIVARPSNGEAIWKNPIGHHVTEKEAVESVAKWLKQQEKVK